MSVPVTNHPPVHAMTVDVEEYFQVSAFDTVVDRDSWIRRPTRVARSVDLLLGMLSNHGIRATFFVLGWIAEHRPEVVRAIAREGHEIASHGYGHERVARLSPEAFEADVVLARRWLEDVSAQRVRGYRAPSFSITRETTWVYPILEAAGYEYSSSVAPVRHDHYGIPDAPRYAHQPSDGDVLEIPVSSVRVAGRNVVAGGGGWFRLYPYWLSRSFVKRIEVIDDRSAIFYTHPWEFDPEQPRIADLDRRTRFRHYLNLDKTARRFDCLLRDFRWSTVADVFIDGRNERSPPIPATPSTRPRIDVPV